MTNSATPPLKITSLVKDYGRFRAVDQVSFEVHPGEIFGLLGPNGAGKTTIISTITTLQEPTSGEVEIFGHDVTKEPKQAKVLTGVVPQELVNHGFFDVMEILKIHSSYYGIWRNEERIKYLIERLGLWEHRHKKVKQLSGGMKRRLLIAKALVHEPKLLLLDEPTAGVDIELRQSLWDFVEELKASGMSILLTTHYLEEAEMLCQRVGILQNGRLGRVGETKALVREMTQREVSFQLSNPVDTIDNPYLLSQSNQTLTFRIPTSLEIGQLISEAKIDVRKIKDLQIQEGRLEDAVRNVMNQGGRA